MSAVSSFFKKVEGILKKLFGSTTWEKTASSVITYVAPLLETIVGLAAGGPAAALVAGVVNTVQSDLATIAAVAQDAQVAPGTAAAAAVTTALNSIKTNLGSLISAAEVKNATKSAEITAAVNTIIGEADALIENLPAAS